jgi:energy-coupling factor transport system permease protein
MIVTPPDERDDAAASFLGRTSPLVKLGVAIAWLVGLATTLDPRPAVLLAVVGLLAVPALGGIRPARLARVLAPATVAIAAIALTNLVYSASNTDPAAAEVARIGPLRLTSEAIGAALALGARATAIVGAGAVFALTTDTTRFVDAIVQQARVPARFAYGANAAYQTIPNLVADALTLVSARRLRGLRPWHPRLLVGLLVRAIRRADQLGLAMDARAFGSGPRTTFRPIRWTPRDALVALAGLAVLAVALSIGR